MFHVKHLAQRIQELKDRNHIDFEQYQVDSELLNHILVILDFDPIALLKKYFWLFSTGIMLISVSVSQLLQMTFYQSSLYYSLSSFTALLFSLLTVFKIYFTKHTFSTFKVYTLILQFYANSNFIKESKEVGSWDSSKGVVYSLGLPILKQVFVKKFYFVGKYIYWLYEWIIFKAIDYIEINYSEEVHTVKLGKWEEEDNFILLGFNSFLEKEFPKIVLMINIAHFVCCFSCIYLHLIVFFFIWLSKL